MGLMIPALVLTGIAVAAQASPNIANGNVFRGEEDHWTETRNTLPRCDEGSVDSCWLRVTVSRILYPEYTCDDQRGAVGCDGREAPGDDGFVQVFVGSILKYTAPAEPASSSAWRESVEFGGVDVRDPIVLTLYASSLRTLASCEVGRAEELVSAGQRRCTGPNGASFSYSVEHGDRSAAGVDVLVGEERDRMASRGLQSNDSSTTPAPFFSTVDADTSTPAALETLEPTAETAADPTPAVTETVADPTLAATEAPVDTETPAPISPPTPAPVVETPAPVALPTAKPTVEETTAPISPPTTAPVQETSAPVEPTPEPTPQPTPEPTPEPTVELTVEPTPEPQPPTDAPVAIGTPEPTPAPETPTSEPVAVTDAPIAPPTDSPSVNSTPAPVAPPTRQPTTPEPSTGAPVGTPRESTVEPTPVPVEITTPTPNPTNTVVSVTPASPPTSQPVVPTVSETSSPVEPDTPAPSVEPTPTPTSEPTSEPSAEPTPEPSAESTPEPSAESTPEPSAESTPEPSAEPTPEPSAESTSEPSAEPTSEPTSEPTAQPVSDVESEPTPSPTRVFITEITPGPVPTPAPPTVSPTAPATVTPTNVEPDVPTPEPTPAIIEFTTSPVGREVPTTSIPTALIVDEETSTTTSPPSVAAVATSTSPVQSSTATSSSSSVPPSAAVAAATSVPLSSPIPISTPPPIASPAPEVDPTPDTVIPETTLPTVIRTPTLAPIVTAPSDATLSGVTAAPVLASVAPSTGPTEVTSAPAPAPSVAPVVASTPAPTVLLDTPAPTAAPLTDDEICTETCISIIQESDHLGAYYDPDCDGGDELIGCNLTEDLDCRKCYTDKDSYEAENGGSSADWPECPCCVATAQGLDPITEECEAEADGTTPAPTSSYTSVDLTNSANDPTLMMLNFDYSTCMVSDGIAVWESSPMKVMQVARYTDGTGACPGDASNATVELIYGTECEADDIVYDWSFDVDTGSYTWEVSGTCDFDTSRRMRRLAEDTGVTQFSSYSVLCNDNKTLVSLVEVDESDSETTTTNGFVYAGSSADGFATVTGDLDQLSNNVYCDQFADEAMSTVLSTAIADGWGNDDDDDSSDDNESIDWIIVLSSLLGLALAFLCFCFCCYRQRKGKEGRAGQMRRNLGYTPDMESKGEGNFGPTNKHVAITRGDRKKPSPETLATKSFQPNYQMHQRAPSEAPSSVIEDNIANNYRPKAAAQSWEKRKLHKDTTKPPTHQHIIGGGPTSEELKAENGGTSSRSESHLSEHSLSQLQAERTAGQARQGQYGYAFEEPDQRDAEMDDDDEDARSAGTGMSGPSKYAPSGYAPSSHHGGVTHDLMSQYEPSVYEADSQYDPSVYGRESEYGDESNYSYVNDTRNSHRGSGYGDRGGGRMGGARHVSGRASIADTAAMSHLGSVMEDDRGDSAYAPSESYVSSYVSSEDDDRQGMPVQSRGGAAGGAHGSSRHSAHRSGREIITARSGFSESTRHSGARSGSDMPESGDYDYDSYRGGGESMEYYDDTSSSQLQGSGAPLADVDENSSEW